MKDPLHITALSNALKSHGPFTDSKGNSSLPQMEYSPFQKTPKFNQRIDSRAETIESDIDFQSFLAALNPAAVAIPPIEDGGAEGAPQPLALDSNAPAPIPPNDPLSVPLPSNEPVSKPMTTPLIEYIRTQKSGPADKPKSRLKAAERVSAESNRSLKRGERRAREKAARQKGKEKEKALELRPIEPMALLKRMDSNPSRSGINVASSSGPRTVEKTPEKHVVVSKEADIKKEVVRENDKEKEKEKESDRIIGERVKGKDRERRRGGTSGVAAILQRDLGIGGPTKRSRAKAATPATSVESEPPEPSNLGAVIMETTRQTPALQQPMDSSSGPVRKARDRPSRRERRAAKLEREESAASAASTASTKTLTPVGILKKRESSGSSAAALTLLSRMDSSVTGNTDSAPSTNTHSEGPGIEKQSPETPPTPTGPRGGGGRGGRVGRSRGGRPDIMMVGNPALSPVTTAGNTNILPPTGPAVDLFGTRGRGRARGRGYRGLRSREGPRSGDGGNVPAVESSKSHTAVL
jgi:regulator of nonsense transcripts 3